MEEMVMTGSGSNGRMQQQQRSRREPRPSFASWPAWHPSRAAGASRAGTVSLITESKASNEQVNHEHISEL